MGSVPFTGIVPQEPKFCKHNPYLAHPKFYIEITKSKPDRLDKPLFGASDGLLLTLGVTCL